MDSSVSSSTAPSPIPSAAESVSPQSPPSTQVAAPGLKITPDPEVKSKSSKPQKVTAKKSKKPIIISLAILLVLALAGGGFYYFQFLRKPAEIIKNDVEFLSDIDAWEKLDSPTVIWSLRADGTGELTTNKENYYDLKWYLSNGKLEIDTAWLYGLSDAFEISLDRESEIPSFTIKNLADETVSTFVPLGSSETTQVEEVEE